MEDQFASVYCDSCNIVCKPWNVRKYEVLFEQSKIHEQDRIALCHICSQIAKYAEKFICNVLSSHKIKKVAKPVPKPIVTLSRFNLKAIEICGTDDYDSVATAVSANLKEKLNEQEIFDTSCRKEDLSSTVKKQEDNSILDIEENSLEESSNSDVIDKEDLNFTVTKQEDVIYIEDSSLEELLNTDANDKDDINSTVIKMEIEENPLEESLKLDVKDKEDLRFTIIKREYLLDIEESPLEKSLNKDKEDEYDSEATTISANLEQWLNEQEIFDDSSSEEVIQQKLVHDFEESQQKELPNTHVDFSKDDQQNTQIISETCKIESLLEEEVPVVYLTPEQCMQERTDIRNSKRYQDSEYKCSDCLLGFCEKSLYLKHMEEHSEGAGQFECELCKKHFPTEPQLSRHIDEHRLRYKCTHCNILRTSEDAIRSHIYVVHNISEPSQFECDECHESYQCSNSLQKHKETKHTLRMRYQCNYCDNGYRFKASLTNHMTTTHPDKVTFVKKKNHECNICGEKFGNALYLRTHLLYHKEKQNYYCAECDKTYKTKSVLQRHLKTSLKHVGYLDYKFPCKLCDKKFAYRENFERHMNSVHLEDKELFQCDQCPKVCHHPSDLRKHKIVVHEKPLSHQCEYCKKMFYSQFRLMDHKYTHTGERPYRCDICLATFAQSTSLYAHKKHVHEQGNHNNTKI